MTASSDHPDRLVQELQRCEADLQNWLQQSTINALWFAVNPADALRAAGLGIPEEIADRNARDAQNQCTKNQCSRRPAHRTPQHSESAEEAAFHTPTSFA